MTLALWQLWLQLFLLRWTLCFFCCTLCTLNFQILPCREASDVIKKGNMCSLFINDLDAGAGRMGAGTQYTVNNQMVNATLMNIADNPSNVQLPGVYKQETIPRVPIICTGVYAFTCPITSLLRLVWYCRAQVYDIQ